MENNRIHELFPKVAYHEYTNFYLGNLGNYDYDPFEYIKIGYLLPNQANNNLKVIDQETGVPRAVSRMYPLIEFLKDI